MTGVGVARSFERFLLGRRFPISDFFPQNKDKADDNESLENNRRQQRGEGRKKAVGDTLACLFKNMVFVNEMG